ncbi:MAG: hypothetical protein HQL50_08315 [Magnetococcales bacterium]|nr:hypothetical protein [Magnetococcales bacterium]
MDAHISQFGLELNEDGSVKPMNKRQRKSPTRAVARKGRGRPKARRSPAAARRRLGREAVKAGMAATLSLSMLTGLKVVKPMKLHGPVSWAFVGLTVAHMLIYELPKKRASSKV